MKVELSSSTKSTIRRIIKALEDSGELEQFIGEIKLNRMLMIQSVENPTEAYEIKLQCQALDDVFLRFIEISKESPDTQG